MKNLQTSLNLIFIYYSGIFSNGLMPMEYHKNKYTLIPSLELMTETALKVISKNKKGFFLMVCMLYSNDKFNFKIIKYNKD